MKQTIIKSIKKALRGGNSLKACCLSISGTKTGDVGHYSHFPLKIYLKIQKIADLGHTDVNGCRKEKSVLGGILQWHRLAGSGRSQQKAVVASDELSREHTGYPKGFNSLLGITLLRI